ncbi:MAG: hypothetical protein ABGY75_06370 [Gemmataceae bacterium]
MLTRLRRQPRPTAVTSPPVAHTFPTPHRDRYGVEIVYYHSPTDLTDCLHTPRVGGGRLVAVFAARGHDQLPPDLAAVPDRLIHTADPTAPLADRPAGWFEPDPRQAVVAAMAGLRAGDTLLLLLPAGWASPAEELIDHARRWRSSPHSSEDEQVG